MILILLTMEKGSNRLLAGPDIITRGFIYVKESDELLEEMQKVLEDTTEDLLQKNITDWGKIKNALRDALSGYVWKKMKRKPMILSVITEVEI